MELLVRALGQCCCVIMLRDAGGGTASGTACGTAHFALERRVMAAVKRCGKLGGCVDALHSKGRVFGPFLAFAAQRFFPDRDRHHGDKGERRGGLELARRLAVAEEAASRQARLLRSASALNAELAATVARYAERFHDAVRVLCPPNSSASASSSASSDPRRSTADRRLRRLKKERLRLQASTARSDDVVATTLLRDLALLGDDFAGDDSDRILESEEKEGGVKGRGRRAEGRSKAQLRALVERELLACERHMAAVNVQRSWRGCFGREVARRARREKAARRIQRCFRLYASRKRAWTWTV